MDSITGDTLQTKEEINEAKEYALNDQDIRDLIGSTNIFTYPHLENVRHIDEVFKSHGNGVSSAIVLFLTDSKNKGHWISLLKKGNTIEIYDPYGNSLKQLPKFLGGVMADKQDPNVLLNLIKKGGYRVVQNHTQDQPESPDINTCGRHAVARIMFGKLDLPEYHKTISKLAKIARVSKDDFITALTADFLGK